MARRQPGKRITGWAAAATLLAAAPLMAACGSSSSSSSDSSSPSASSSASDNSSSDSSSSAGDSGSQANDQSTPSGAAGSWVTAVIKKDAKQVCELSTTPGDSSKPSTAQTCNPSTLKQLTVGLAAMSKAFTPPNASGDPKVQANGPTPKGNKAVVPAGKIKVDGKSLRSIMLAKSHGMDPKGAAFKLQTVKINNKWYISDSDMGGGGTQTLHPQGQGQGGTQTLHPQGQG